MIHSKDEEPNLQGHLMTMKMKRSEISNYGNAVVIDDDTFPKIWKHIKQLKHVTRLNGIPTIQKYTVTEHCYYTGILFDYFALKEKIEITPDDLNWVFVHDLIESVTGDILYPAKNYSENTKSLWTSLEVHLTEKNGAYDYLNWYTDLQASYRMTRDKWNLFKAMDLLELDLFCIEEIELGNKGVMILRIERNCFEILTDCPFKSVKKWMLEA